jgi:hypothetical protein
MGPNFVLDKGFLATGATAYAFGEPVTLAGAGDSIARAGSGATNVIGVCYEALESTRLATGKAVIAVRVLGIARVLAGAAVARDSKVAVDATCRAVAVTRAAAGAQPAAVFGIAMTAATQAGDMIDVLLTPGMTW